MKRALLWFALAALPLCTIAPAAAQVGGISYTATPLIGRVYFDKNAGLEDAAFAGGRLGFGFGEYAELNGLYLVSNGLQTDFSDFSDFGGAVRERFALLPSRDVSLTQMGADLKFNLGRGSIFPFVSLGTGVLEFDPENLSRSRLIYLSGSAGLQLGLSDHFTLIAQVEDLVYRYAPPLVLLSENDLGDLGLSAADFRQVNVNNLAVRVGLQVYVGGRARGELTAVDRALREQLSGGLLGISLQIEPIGGVVDFADDLGLREAQRVAGASVGFDLGPYLGLRGTYWRGIKPGSVTDFDNIQAYGGEIKLKFGAIAGKFIPHLTLGGGYLDVLEGYGGSPADRPYASGGGGLSLALTRSIHLHGAIRALLMSTEEADDVSDPSQLTSSLFYGAGISFGIGRKPADVGPFAAPDAEDALARARRQNDSLRVALQRARSQPGEIGEAAAEERWISIPVPESGELYVRYGADKSQDSVSVRPRIETPDEPVTADDIQQIVREALRRELRQSEPERRDSAAVERLMARIDELEKRLAARGEVSEASTPAGYRLGAVLPFTGTGLSAEHAVLAGLRAELHTHALSGVRFIPEVVTYVGDEGLAFGLNGGALFSPGFEIASVRPYSGLGLGLITRDGIELVFNLIAGLEQIGSDGRFFAEYMSQDFFALNRVVLGYRIAF